MGDGRAEGLSTTGGGEHTGIFESLQLEGSYVGDSMYLHFFNNQWRENLK